MERSLSELPEDVMLHIFADLYHSNQDAVRLSRLSKLMLSVMQKRPNLVLDYNKLAQKYKSSPRLMKRYSEELDYIDSTLDKYHRQGIPLQSLTLKTDSNKAYELPQSVFEAKSLVELELANCVLKPLKIVSWPKLKRLSLTGGCEANQEELENMFRGSPCIEILKVEALCFKANFKGCNYKIANLANLKQLEIKLGRDQRLEVSQVPNLESLVCRSTGLVDLADTEYPNLKTLDISGRVNEHYHLLDNFASKFPMLENLYVKDMDDLERINLSSSSLKVISLVDMTALKVASFDVPSLVRFTYKISFSHYKISDNFVPYKIPMLLSFTGNSSGWSSSIELDQHPSQIWTPRIWFERLNYFLVELNGPDTSIAVRLDEPLKLTLDDQALADTITSVPKIKEFSISNTNWSRSSMSTVSDFLKGIFLICQPQKITFLDCDNHKFPELLYEKLMKSGIPHVTDFEMLQGATKFKDWHKFLEVFYSDPTVKNISFNLEY